MYSSEKYLNDIFSEFLVVNKQMDLQEGVLSLKTKFSLGEICELINSFSVR